MPVIRRQSTPTSNLASDGTSEMRPELHSNTGRDIQRPFPASNGPVEGEEDREPQVFATEMMCERVKLLGPPEGIGADRVGPAPMVWKVWFRGWARALRARVWTRANVTREVYIRIIKSCILVVKVCSYLKSSPEITQSHSRLGPHDLTFMYSKQHRRRRNKL